MSFDIIATDAFVREAKRLAKKYLSIRSDIAALGKLIASDPTMGTPLGNNVYKIRMAIASKSKGKSGGARVITYVKLSEQTVLLIAIYNKGEQDSISDAEIKALIKPYL